MGKAEPGWYFFVVCSSCGEEIIFEEAPPPEKLDEPLRSRGVTVACPHCQSDDTYRAAQVGYGQVEENNE